MINSMDIFEKRSECFSRIAPKNFFMIRETRSFVSIGVKTHEASIGEYMDIFEKRSECFSRIAPKIRVYHYDYRN